MRTRYFENANTKNFSDTPTLCKKTKTFQKQGNRVSLSYPPERSSFLYIMLQILEAPRLSEPKTPKNKDPFFNFLNTPVLCEAEKIPSAQKFSKEKH